MMLAKLTRLRLYFRCVSLHAVGIAIVDTYDAESVTSRAVTVRFTLAASVLACAASVNLIKGNPDCFPPWDLPLLRQPLGLSNVCTCTKANYRQLHAVTFCREPSTAFLVACCCTWQPEW